MKLRGIIINQVSKSPKRSRYWIMIIFFFLWNISMNIMKLKRIFSFYLKIIRYRKIANDFSWHQILYCLFHNLKRQSSTPGGMEKMRILCSRILEWKGKKEKGERCFRSSQRPGNSIRENHLLVKRMITIKFFQNDHLYQWNFT